MQVPNGKKYMKLVLVVVIFLMLCRPAAAYPPDPDNAALLYYQAFLLVEHPDESMSEMIADLSDGEIEPNEEIREHIERSKVAIELAASAAQIPHCDWGLKYSDGISMEMPYAAQARDLARLIAADSRILTQEGDFISALERCLLLQRMARQVGKGTLVSYLLECGICRISNGCTQNILAKMPLDLETLDWLKNKLSVIDPLSPIKSYIESEFGMPLSYMKIEKKEDLISLITEWTNSPESEETKSIIEQLRSADEEFFERIRAYHRALESNVINVLDLPYPQAYARLFEANEKTGNDATSGISKTIPTAVLIPSLGPGYSIGIRSQSNFNAVRAAVAIYIIKAKTGQLPDALPEGSPKDLFSGKDFEYEMTADGFILRCQGKDLHHDKFHEWEFKVAK
jgi:hypothetical protein